MVKPALRVADGTLEGLKWLALVLMTLDHVNHFALQLAYPWMFELGRGAMPLFAFVLAAQCQRPQVQAAWQPGAQTGTFWTKLWRQDLPPRRVLQRMLAYGAVATVPMVYLTGLWLPANVLFTLALATVVLLWWQFAQPKTVLPVVVALLLGGLVDYLWLAPLMALAMYNWLQKASAVSLGLMVLSVASLWAVNNNLMALWVVPFILLAPTVTLRCSRWPRLFYRYYLGHLVLLALVRLLEFSPKM